MVFSWNSSTRTTVARKTLPRIKWQQAWIHMINVSPACLLQRTSRLEIQGPKKNWHADADSFFLRLLHNITALRLYTSRNVDELVSTNLVKTAYMHQLYHSFFMDPIES